MEKLKCSFLKRVPEDIRVLTVCEREGDFYELFSEAAHLGADFLVRIVQNRMINEGKWNVFITY